MPSPFFASRLRGQHRLHLLRALIAGFRLGDFTLRGLPVAAFAVPFETSLRIQALAYIGFLSVRSPLLFRPDYTIYPPPARSAVILPAAPDRVYILVGLEGIDAGKDPPSINPFSTRRGTPTAAPRRYRSGACVSCPSSVFRAACACARCRRHSTSPSRPCARP